MGLGDFVDEGGVVGFGEPTLFVQEGEDAHGLLQQVDGRLQIQPEVDELPLDAFALVFLLLQDEHGVVEELLQLLVGVVDAQLFEGVDLEDLETGDVEDTDERRHRHPLRSEGGGDGEGRRGQEGKVGEWHVD